MKLSLRAWATPLVVGSFLVMASSGMLMFFHLNTGLMKGLHEWAGLVMVVGGVAHLMLNWRPFTTYFKRPLAGTIMGLGAIALGASFVPVGASVSPEASLRSVMGAVAQAPVSVLAELSHQTPDAVIADLAAAGYAGATAESTLSGLTGGDGFAQLQAAAAVFATEAAQ